MKPAIDVRLFTCGGDLPPVMLRNILILANSLGADSIEPGLRQEIYFSIPMSEIDNPDCKTRLNSISMNYDLRDSNRSNVVSSLPALDIFSSNSWKREGVFNDLLSALEKKHLKLKVNLIDPDQRIFSFYDGDLNFIASAIPDFWELYYRTGNDSNLQHWPEGIPTGKILETINYFESGNAEVFFGKKSKKTGIRDQKFLAEGKAKENLNNFAFPPIEGFHKYGNKYWLGIYSRDYQFSIGFIEALCILCSESKNVKIGLTPWKTFLFRDIEEGDLRKWEDILRKYQRNMRHSSLELAWRIPDRDPIALKLKQRIVRQLDAREFFHEKSSFGISTNRENPLTQIIIQGRKVIPFWAKWMKYNVYRQENIATGKDTRRFLGSSFSRRKLANSIAKFLSSEIPRTENPGRLLAEPVETGKAPEKIKVYQCSSCWSIYDEKSGVPEKEILPGTQFPDLPSSFGCFVCDSPKSNFKEISLASLQ